MSTDAFGILLGNIIYAVYIGILSDNEDTCKDGRKVRQGGTDGTVSVCYIHQQLWILLILYTDKLAGLHAAVYIAICSGLELETVHAAELEHVILLQAMAYWVGALTVSVLFATTGLTCAFGTREQKGITVLFCFSILLYTQCHRTTERQQESIVLSRTKVNNEI